MIYEILNAEGNVINTVVANEDFVAANYENYRPFVPPQEAPIPKEDTERAWRDSELFRTDSLVLLPDYPYKEQLTVYRQALRDWPATSDFPDTRPTLGI